MRQSLLLILSFWVFTGHATVHIFSRKQFNEKGLQRNQVIEVLGIERNYHLYLPK